MISPELDLKPIHDALQVGLEPDEICIREGIVLKICPESRFPFEFFCWRSPPMVKEMDCFIKYSKGRERLLDVGAFHGLFSLVFRKLNLHSLVVLAEPCEESYDVLENNLFVNESAFGCANISISDHDGSLDMHGECGHWVAEESRQHRHVDDRHQSRCRTGDEFCESGKIEPDTIKIDVEGHEVKVLRGLQETIARCRPVIFIEIHLDKLAGQGESINNVFGLLPNYEFIYTGNEFKVDLKNLPMALIPERDPHFVCLPCP